MAYLFIGKPKNKLKRQTLSAEAVVNLYMQHEVKFKVKVKIVLWLYLMLECLYKLGSS